MSKKTLDERIEYWKNDDRCTDEHCFGLIDDVIADRERLKKALDTACKIGGLTLGDVLDDYVEPIDPNCYLEISKEKK